MDSVGSMTTENLTLQDEAFELLRMEVLEYLSAADFHVSKNYAMESDEDIQTGMDLICALVNMVSLILRQAEDCSCPVMETVYRIVKDPEEPFAELVQKYYR